MENNKFFEFKNSKYAINEDQLYVIDGENFVKCCNDQYFDFCQEILNNFIEDEKKKRYWKSLNSAVMEYKDLFKELGFLIEHFSEDSYYDEEQYARLWNEDKSFHFRQKINRKIYDERTECFKHLPIIKISEEVYFEKRAFKLMSLGDELYEINAFSDPFRHSK